MEIDDAKARLKMIEKKRKKLDEELAEESKLSWIKRLQIDDSSHRKLLKRLETHQKEAFEHQIRNHHPSLKNEWEDLFGMFFTDLLNEKTKSIINWLKENNYQREENIDDYGVKIL